MCDSHPWGDPMGLACLRADQHTSGHVYTSAWLADKHDSYDPEEGR